MGAAAARAEDAPTLDEARRFLHQRTDAPCEPRNIPNLIRADQSLLLAGAGTMQTRLYDLYCDHAGAQTTRVFVLWSSFAARFRLLHFASPVFTFRYKDEASRVALEGPVCVTGFEALTALPAPAFDPESRTITSATPWGNRGEAGTQTRWAFNPASARFDLVVASVDPYHESDLPPSQRAAWAGKSIPLFPAEPCRR